MASNVTAVYNTDLKQVVMLIVDCENLADPSYNPPDCIQVPIDAEVYGALETNQDTYDFIYETVNKVLAEQP